MWKYCLIAIQSTRQVCTIKQRSRKVSILQFSRASNFILDSYGLALSCWETQLQDEKGRLDCNNRCGSHSRFNEIYSRCRNTGGSIEECVEHYDAFLELCRDRCHDSYPHADDDCNKAYVCFRPEKCAVEGAALAAASTACELIKKFGAKQLCKQLLRPLKKAYKDCLNNEAIVPISPPKN